jgi:predicted dehydrogenase
MSTRLRYGILSTARIARKAVAGINASRNGMVAAVASRDADKARAAAKEWGCPEARIYGSYEALLDDPDVQAVYNPLPNGLHGEWTKRSADAGKHVLCEKPLTSDDAEAAEVVAHCRARRVTLMEAFMYRHHPLQHAVRKALDAGTVGKVHTLRGAFEFPLENPADIRLQPGLAGGALWDVGCYPVNLSRFLFGAEPTHAYAVAEFMADGRTDLTLTGLLRYPADRAAIIECSFRRPYRCLYEVCGTKGRISVPQGFLRDPEPGYFEIIRDGATERVEVGAAEVYKLQAEHFAECVLAGKPLAWPAEDGLANMRALTALLKSAQTGQAVSVV